MKMAPVLPAALASGGGRRLMALLMALLFLSACMPSTPTDEQVRKEIKELKAKVAAMQEKLKQVEAEQQAILAQLKKPAPAPIPMAMPSLPSAPETLTVGQLLQNKDRYLGTRVTVKGMPGPVMVHHKALMLESPQGMVEVLFGNLPDQKLIQRLTSTTLDKPITVTGVVNPSSTRGAVGQIQINAEAVEF
jgi:outer membrane murein-binding lipoprotein Lpp